MKQSKMMLRFGIAALAIAVSVVSCWADDDNDNSQGKGNSKGKGNAQACADLPTAAQLKAQLVAAAALTAAPLGGTVGGIFNGTRMWGAIVNRDGALCSVTTSTTDPTQVWPGSQAIAKAKAYTANAFSLDDFVLSTARLYTFVQPGHSLASLGQSNPFDPGALAAPGDATSSNNQIAGGMIFFGGGVPIYKNGKIVGGLGVSGDTSCADHEIAKRTRHLLNLDPATGPLVDDIRYTSADGPGVYTHPLCLTTYRNGALLGTEANATTY